MLVPTLVRDLPLCFPGRACVDVPPGGAQAMYLVAGLTPASAGIAAALWLGLGVALVIVVAGLRQHWRGQGLRPRAVLLAVALVLGGLILAWLMRGWLGEAALAYGGADGRAAAPVPAVVIGSWPLVRSAAVAGVALGVLALLAMLSIAAVPRRRDARRREGDLG
ncbi:hypothetical protein D1781_06865 [Amnibacterium setariae]|uniref:Uncharacterized protein n=1 Tax=Amnibacterium setariae TaxID=2306585 RepID=A0A3A1U2C6_9MICO|nr:hypothetical protein D1781_06865 [Amnibacterium setariae]